MNAPSAPHTGLPRIVILGAGFAGHTAALHLSRLVRSKANVTVIAPRNRFTWFPSLIWVGTGTMSAEKVWFPLAPVYEKLGFDYIDGRAESIRPDERVVDIRRADGSEEHLAYDYLVNATGPYLNFEGTPGLGPKEGTTQSVCSIEHALGARDAYLENVAQLKKGARRRFVIGVGHPGATCQGAAFEYIMNVDADLRRRGLRDRAELVWLSNEPAAGDFGVDGVEARIDGKIVTGSTVIDELFKEREIQPILAAGVTGVGKDGIAYDRVGFDPATLEYDFAMLIP
ncbi:MAG: FAD-dependent oxidoreductase, partial [Candidatus Eremiobacteraeota bacterium]|nr:FAD-dependent oxidoreductase [Candidatus Eremiobacteraeota bacterium]